MRHAKNVQSSITSEVFVGLRAETLHAIDLHADNLHDDEGNDVFNEIRTLKEQLQACIKEIDELRTRLNALKLSELSDVSAESPSDGDALVFSSETSTWQLGTLSSN